MSLRQKFGNYIRKVRLDKGYSLRQVQRQSGISNAYISQLENASNKSMPKNSTIKKLAKGLRIPVERLLKVAGQNTSHDIYDEIKNGDIMTWQGHPINKKELAEWIKQGHWL